MLKKLREKPDHIKKIISLVIAIIISAVIFVVWLSSFDARQNGDEAREKTLSPIGGFMEVFQGVVSDVKNNISGMPSYVENIGGQEAETITTTTLTSPSVFDFSGVVIIDQLASSTATTTSF